MKFKIYLQSFRNSTLVTNSLWGVASSVFQNIFLSLFFVIVARSFSTFEFAQFLIATTLYQLIAAFSAMGLGQWFIREYIEVSDKIEFTSTFLKVQILFGLFFYGIHIGATFLLYEDVLVQNLAIILGLNVIFDNLIYAIKCLNIAQFQQKKTFTILLVDAFLRFLITVILLIYPFSIVTLSVFVILIRFATVNFFIQLGVPKEISPNKIYKAKVSLAKIKDIVFSNWSFVVIGSISIIYWRVASIIISKTLRDIDVANYEISFKIFLLAQLIPLILSSTIFPNLVSFYKEKSKFQFNRYFRKIFLWYSLFGLLVFTFIYSYAELIIPFAFGGIYQETFKYTIQMFLTMICFPTALLQANVLIAMKKEKLDMVINVVSLMIYLLLCYIGFQFIKSLAVINYSIFISWISFHLFQSYSLIKQDVISFKFSLSFYVISGLFVLSYIFLAGFIDVHFLFFLFWGVISIIFIISFRNLKKMLLIKGEIIKVSD